MNGARDFRRSALAICALFLGLGLRAEPPPVASPAAGQSRRLSPKITEAVSAKLPKYAAPSPRPPAARVIDSPHQIAGDSADDLFTLPKMVVRPSEMGPESDYAWLSPKGRVALAMRKYPSLRIGNFFGLNNGIALAMLQEEREAEARAALVDSVERTGIDDGPEAQRLKHLVKAAVQRPNMDWMAGRSRN